MLSTLLAQRINNPLGAQLSPKTNQEGVDAFSNFISTVVSWLFVVGVLVFVLFLFINAIKYIASQGDKQGLESARQGILHSLIGLVVLFGLFALLRLIEAVFGVCVLNIYIPVLGVSGSVICTGNQNYFPIPGNGPDF